MLEPNLNYMREMVHIMKDFDIEYLDITIIQNV